MDGEAKAGVIIAFVGLALMVIILAVSLHSCGAFEPSSYEHKCSYCDKHAEYSDNGRRYCREHYLRYHS